MAGKLALNLITVKQASFKRKLQAAKEAGFTGVGLWADELERLADEGSSLDDVAALMDVLELEAAEMCFVGGWMYNEAGAKERALERARRRFAAAQRLRCGCVIACAAGSAGDLAEAAADFGALCDLAARHRLRVALEFLGGAAQVKDVATAWDIAQTAHRPNGGLVVDTFHYYTGGSTLEQLAAVPAEKIYLVHINDCIDLPKSELNDGHRVYPGLGVIPLEGIVGTLSDAGYNGYYSLEMFNEQYWQTDAGQVAREGVRALQRLGLG